MVNKITLLRMKKICWKLKKEKAFDEATSISLNTKGAGEKYALNMFEYVSRKEYCDKNRNG